MKRRDIFVLTLYSTKNATWQRSSKQPTSCPSLFFCMSVTANSSTVLEKKMLKKRSLCVECSARWRIWTHTVVRTCTWCKCLVRRLPFGRSAIQADTNCVKIWSTWTRKWPLRSPSHSPGCRRRTLSRSSMMMMMMMMSDLFCSCHYCLNWISDKSASLRQKVQNEFFDKFVWELLYVASARVILAFFSWHLFWLFVLLRPTFSM